LQKNKWLQLPCTVHRILWEETMMDKNWMLAAGMLGILVMAMTLSGC